MPYAICAIWPCAMEYSNMAIETSNLLRMRIKVGGAYSAKIQKGGKFEPARTRG